MATILAGTPETRTPAGAPDDPRARRRERFLERMGRGVAVLCSAPELIKSRDTEVLYRQDSDFFYLTGFSEPGVAVLTPHDGRHRFTLFVRPRDPERETWNGPRAGVEGATERFGADAAYPLAELDARLKALLEPADAIWYALGSNEKMDRRLVSWIREWRLRRARSGKGPSDVMDPAGILDAMRVVKEPEEIGAIRRACELSAQAHVRAMRAARPGIGEWELANVIDSTFRAAGPDAGPAYPTIVGSGANATILHYVLNAERADDGALVLIDAGAEWGMYCGDITRTFPANGRFTAPQRRVYDAVLRAEEQAIAMVRPGVTIAAIHEATRLLLARELVEMGVLQGDPETIAEGEEIKRFYMHQTSHWLGLDVHDAGDYRARGGDWLPLAAGMVFTIEPGLYIPAAADDVPAEYRGIGVRIEDDVLVTEDGCEVLTRGVPVAPEEIEALVGADAG
ncbi:aminopeptidase P N-terminal domain-containing protein [Longimicrobium sp.]|uniref:aminopeptidase P N-terminal domain-containing protein n=1 Tax=Longimicrobium sp. TaxID=2029185 RepID=UPI002C8D7AAF|nr:aminopeptidase P N-terminal domain-containing protein [Longimicrobium sp.]HSU14049.1 aminopeptidase P N-terminal domain-containing protein [Longimicrobium sp.]